MNKNVSNNYLLDRIGRTEALKQNLKQKNKVDSNSKGFREVFDSVQRNVKISKHAEERLRTRNINLSDKKLEEVSKAMDKASDKGIRDALIFVEGNALIASVQNRTIVTCAKQEDLDSRIITNIDGAILL